MPVVKGKHFPYTPQGMKQAQAAKKMPMKGMPPKSMKKGKK